MIWFSITVTLSASPIPPSQVTALENKVVLFASALEVYKADEIFDQLEDNGDPFPLLAAMEPDEVCVVCVVRFY